MITHPTPHLLEHIRAMARAMRIHEMSMRDARFAFEREYVIAAMVESKGNACQAARALQIHRNTLTRDFHRLGIEPNDLRKFWPVPKKGKHESSV